MRKAPNATKWTEERVIELLEDIMHDAYNADVDYLGIALVRQGLYIQLWSYWRKIFAGHDRITETMMQIESIFEARLVQSALRKKASPWVSIFLLKNKYRLTAFEPEEEPEKQPLMVVKLTKDVVIMVGEGYDGRFQRVPEANESVPDTAKPNENK